MASINDTQLGNFIEASIKRNGWSIRKAALQIGVSPAYLSKLINHKADSNPKPETLDKLAIGLKLSQREVYDAAELTLNDDKGIAPDWATEKDINDLHDFLATNGQMTYKGMDLTKAQRERVDQIITQVFWEELEKEKKKNER